MDESQYVTNSSNLKKVVNYKVLHFISNEDQEVLGYKIRISRSNFWPMLKYLYRVSFLTTLDIYKTYFKGCHTSKIYVESALVHYFLQRNYCIFTLRVSWPMSFLIFIVDELKNFATNNLFKLLELVTYWDPCIIG